MLELDLTDRPDTAAPTSAGDVVTTGGAESSSTWEGYNPAVLACFEE